MSKGIAAILIVAVVGIIALGTAFYALRPGALNKFVSDERKEAQTTQWREKKVSCDGDFFDSHAHFDGLVTRHPFAPGPPWVSLTPQELARRMSEYNVGCAVLFVASSDMDKDFNRMQEDLSGTEVGFLPFFPGYEPAQLTIPKIDKVYKGREKVFFGVGEIGFYQGPLVGTSLSQDPWPAIFEYAAKENLILMFHPTEKEANDLEKMLSQYPNTKVILHGFESLNTGRVGKWLRSYKNFHFTYDVATMLDGYLYRVQNATDFIAWYEANKKQYIASVRGRLLPLLEAAPDRVMWGTDVVASWHTESEVYSRLMEFSKELVDSLPLQYRDNYAHTNAQRIFGSGVVFEKP